MQLRAIAMGALMCVSQLVAPGAYAQSDDGPCLSIGQREANQRGATLVAATRTGDSCEIVILVPAANGQRPAREVIVVPRAS